MKLIVLCLVLTLAVSTHAALELLADLNGAKSGDSFPTGFVYANGQYFFAATSKEDGRQLYAFNSTSGDAPYQVFQVNNDKIGSGIPRGQGFVAAVGASNANNPNPVVVFAGYNQTVGTELWVSDGFTTSLAFDIYPGNRSSDPAELTTVGSSVYFVATGNKIGREIFRFTYTNSRPVLTSIDIFKGTATKNAAPPSSNPASLTIVTNNGQVRGVYFTAYTADAGRELYYISAGGASAALVDINKGAGGSFPTQLTNIGNGKLFVQATTPATGTDLFVVSTSTSISVDVNPGPGSSNAAYFAASPFPGESKLVYFSAYTPATGYEVFVTDGSSNKKNTAVKFDINQGPADSFPSFLTAANGLVYLQYNDAAGNINLGYFTNDSTTPVSIATNLQPYQPVTGAPGGVNNNQFYYQNGSLFFYSWVSQSAGRELTYITAAAPTTVNTVNVNGKAAQSSLLYTDDFVPVADPVDPTVFYYGAQLKKKGYEPVKVSIPSATVTLIEDINRGATVSSFAGRNGLYRLNGRSLFTAYGGAQGVEAFSTLGAKKRTKVLANVQKGADSSYPSDFAAIGKGWAYAAFSSAGGRELFGVTPTGKTSIQIDTTNVNAGTASSNPSSIVNYLGDLYFSAFTPATGYELFTVSKVGNGADLVADIFPGNGSSFPTELTVFNNLLYFVASGNGTGAELWYTDGTEEGTILAADINPGAGSSNPSNFVATNTLALGPLLYFTANDGSTGIELWVTDSLSVTRVADINTGAGDSTPSQFVFFKNLLFFVARDAVVGEEVRAVAPQSTFYLTGAISDVAKGVADSDIHSLTLFKRNLFFGASEPVNGSEVYKTRGTKASTALFADVSKGERSSSPRNFVAVSGKLFFSADDIDVGREVFVAHPAAKGDDPKASVFQNLNGVASSDPVLFKHGNKLVVSAYASAVGFELWGGRAN